MFGTARPRNAGIAIIVGGLAFFIIGVSRHRSGGSVAFMVIGLAFLSIGLRRIRRRPPDSTD
jgi:glucose dehydrogenase